MAAARGDIRTAAKPTADQMRVLKMLEQLSGAADWRGVAAQERAARAVAAAVQTSMPGIASFVYCILGRAYDSLRDFSKAIEYPGRRPPFCNRQVPRVVLDGLAEVPCDRYALPRFPYALPSPARSPTSFEIARHCVWYSRAFA